MTNEEQTAEQANHRHVTVVQLQAHIGEPGYTVYFEPEGGDRFLKPGDHLTITFNTSEPQEIDIALHKGGLVLWRPIRGDVKVSIIDRTNGAEITDLWKLP